jgi:hypothetical protein
MNVKSDNLFTGNPIKSGIIGAVIYLCVSMVPAGVAATTLPYSQSASSSQAPNKAQTAPVTARQGLAGAWKLNAAQSDDPQKKMEAEDADIPQGENGPAAPIAGQLGGNGSSGPPPNEPGAFGGAGGFGSSPSYGGAGGGTGSVPPPAPAHRWETDKDRLKKMEYMLPAAGLTIEQKDSEFDLADDKGRKQILYTDGRKLRKSKDDKLQEISARVDAGHLVYEEKSPHGGKMTRTFQLSDDGRQMYQTLEIDEGIYNPIIIRYVYDAAPGVSQP